ncbi:MAG: MucBP domain-containing protein, partial [Ligilactobacillus sp.]|nr:MucBP domain-containing protein [Ligilactobacillus sp.]
SESVVGDKVSTDYQALIQSYLDKGYVLVSADALPANFDNNDAVDQNVVLHLAHGTKEVAGTPKTVTQTVTYVYGNGPKKGQPVTEAQVKEYVFTSTDTIDTVTGAILSTAWSPAQTTEMIQSPTIAGYTPDRDEISGQTITHDSEDLSTVVTYTAGDQTVKVHYIDVYDGANKELTDQLQTITGKAGAAYTNTLWDYAQAGYELVSAQPEATSGNFDEDPDADQEHYVYLTHALKQVVGTPVTVSQTINYVYRTGPKAGQMVSADSVNSHTFVPTYTVDQVTKENVGEPSWAPETAEFSAVTSPTVSGYTSDQPVVEKMTITPSSKDSVVTVYYDANEQRLTYTVIDDGDNGKVLANNELLATGDSESVVGDKVSTDYQALIQSYLDKGYILVSADA